MPGVSSQPSFLERLHSCAREVAQLHSEHTQIDKEAAVKLGKELQAKQELIKAAAGRLAFPIKFDTIESEVNFLALYHMLSFGSGWDEEIKQRSQRDAAETIQYGALGIHISGQRVDHHWMKAFSLFQVHNFFGLESHVDQAVPNLPGVTMSRPGPLQPLVLAVKQVVAETGDALGQEGSSSLGAKILGIVEAATSTGRSPSASELVEELATSLPGFQDQGLYDGQKLEFARKAQALAGALMARFGSNDPRFAFADSGSLAADSAPFLPAVFRAKGVLRLSDELAASIDGGEELPAGPHERGLRAAAIAAADLVVEAAEGAFSAYDLGCYMHMLAEEGQELGGAVHKHRTKCTAY